MRKVWVIILVVVAGCAADEGKTPNLLTKDQMAPVMWDIMAASSFTNNFLRKDSTKDLAVENVRLQQQVFQLHKVTREQFYDSYNYYSLHPDQMRVILDSITQRAERERLKLFEKRYGNTTVR